MPKFLCLPGYLQSGKVFAEKSSGLRKILTKKLNYDLDYIDPPIVINTKEELPFSLAVDEDEASKKWLLIVDQNLNRCWWQHTQTDGYHGFHEAVDCVVKHIKENGPYDGIIGFSQGAAMAAMISNTIGTVLPSHGHFKVGVFFSGFVFTVPVDSDAVMLDLNSAIEDVNEYKGKVRMVEGYEKYFTPPDFPTTIVSIYGKEDGVVPPVRTEYLNSTYSGENLKVFMHDGGHYLPNKKQFLNPIVDCIKEVFEAKPSL